MAQTRWRGEQWSEDRGEAVVTLLQGHMSWQLVTTKPITQRHTQTHSHYQIRPASSALTCYQHKCDKHIRINQHSLSTPSAIIRPKIISYTFSELLVTAIFIIIIIMIDVFSLTITEASRSIQGSASLYIHPSIVSIIHLFI